ncbi:MAG: ABC transporter permease [Bacteroidia bacterium]|nr:ABC transporter permease [Bacteroidia bacterium]
MISRLIVSIARSLLLARLRQTMVAAVGVTFSIMMFVTLLGFMNGLNDMLDGLILNRTAHIRLFNDIKPKEKQAIEKAKDYKNRSHFIHSVKSSGSRREIYNVGAITKAISRDPRVLGYAPKINAPVFFNDGNIEITGVINGIDVEAEARLFFFKDYVTKGNPMDVKTVANSIILGKALADKLLVDIGDRVYVNNSQGERFSLKVVGFFESGLMELDKVNSYASLATTQKIVGKSNNYITDLQIKLKDLNLAPAMAKDYSKLFECDSEDIQTANAQFETGSNVRSIISYAVGITLLIVAGFGIYNILNMMIFEKMESIAILKATGFSGKDVRKVFMVIAVSIGLIGGLAGEVMGFLLSNLIDNIPFNTPALPTIKTFPVNYSPKYYIISFVFALLTTYFAGYFPARKASRVDPVVIIRGK